MSRPTKAVRRIGKKQKVTKLQEYIYSGHSQVMSLGFKAADESGDGEHVHSYSVQQLKFQIQDP